MRDHNYYVYLVTNKHRTTLYIGMTNDLERRMAVHKNGEIEGFTQRYHVNRLVWFDHYRDVNAAIAFEKKLKGWLRSKKVALIEKQNPRWFDLSADWNNSRISTMGGQAWKKWSEILLPLRGIRMTIFRSATNHERTTQL